MIKHIIGLSFIIITTTAFSQTLEERVDKLEQDVQEIKEVNATLKSNYQLFKGVQRTKVNEVEIKFIKATGDKLGKTVTVELLITNLGESKETTGEQFKILDELGNEFALTKMLMGSENRWLRIMTYKDAPVKVKVTFGGVPDSTIYVRRVNFSLADRMNVNKTPVSIDGAQIEWE